jgi:hypothetical protein
LESLGHGTAAAEAGRNSGWIAETQVERQRALTRSRAIPQSPQRVSHLSAEDIAAILDELGDLITALGEAEPDHKLEVYRSLGLRLTYHPETQTVRAKSILASTGGTWFVSEGDTNQNPTWTTAARSDPAVLIGTRCIDQ